jgi:hypothetical protein
MLKSALETASKNDPDAFKRCFPDLIDFMQNYEALSAEAISHTELVNRCVLGMSGWGGCLPFARGSSGCSSPLTQTFCDNE